MAGSDNELSIIDLIEYYEPGPVLKERTPNLNRTSFYPGDGEHHAEDGEPEPGKKVTKKARLDLIRKKALGLTDVPRAAIPGNEGYLGGRDSSAEEGPEEFSTWFGGQEDFVLDNLEKEDKLPTNKKRNDNKPESGDLNKMSFEKSELLKLAKALSVRGQVSASDSVIRLTKQAIADEALGNRYSAAGTDRDMVLRVLGGNNVWEKYKKITDPSEAFFISTFSDWWPGALDKEPMGTDEGLMLAALLRGPDESSVKKKFEARLVETGTPKRFEKHNGKHYKDLNILQIVEAELGGEEKQVAELIIKGGLNADDLDFDIKNFKDDSDAITCRPVPGPAKSLPGGTGAAKEKPWKPVQSRINELFADGGALQSRRPDPWEPLATDGDMGPKSTAAYNAATGSSYDPNAIPWPIPKALTPEQALDELNAQIEEVVAPTPAEPADTTRGEEPEEATPEAQAIAEGKAAGDLQDWYITDSDDGSHYVGIGKDGTKYEYQIFAISKEPNETGKHDAVRITDRGDDPRFTGARFLEGKEDRRLISQIIRDRLGRAQRTRYTDVIRGQAKSVKGDTRRGRRRGAERAERAAAGTRRRDLRQRGRAERKRR
jgi:hypothetical protein